MKKILFDDDISSIIENKNELVKDYKIYNGCADDEEAARIIIDDDYNYLLEVIHLFDTVKDYDYIICVADLGLWYGRRKASKTFKNLFDAITCASYDYNKIYFNKSNSTITKESIHHDGSNIYKYYFIKGGKKHAINIKLLEGLL